MERKIKTFFIALIFIWIILMIVGILTGEIDANWSFFIAILSVVLLFFVSQSYWRKVKYGRIIKLINDRDYLKVLKEIEDYSHLKKGTSLSSQMIHLNIAVLCLDNHDYVNYEKYISRAVDERLQVLKQFWNIIYLCTAQKLHDITTIMNDYLTIKEVDVVFLHQYKLQKEIIEIILQYYTDKTAINKSVLQDLINESKTISVRTILEKIYDNT